ncbi:MAG: hypothetical protein WCJ30_11505 [Deltaproteobacteria bacterium]
MLGPTGDRVFRRLHPAPFALFVSATLATLVVTLVVTGGDAQANERHFAFTHESATLPAGSFELEPWVTTRLGRPGYFASLEYRFEFEVGVTDRLQLAVYANGVASAEGMDLPGMTRTTRGGFTGSSVEVKYRLLDSVADPIGLALYGEATGGPEALELEGKVILDRRFGRGLFAANLVYAHEWGFEPDGTIEDENEVQVLVAAGFFVTDWFSLGLEVREHNIFTPAAFESAVLYAGPTVSFSAAHWWLTLAVTPQLAALHGATPGEFRNFHDHEALDARLLLGIHL